MTTQLPTAPRIAPVEEIGPDLEEVLAGALLLDGKPLNIFGVLGHHPKLLKRFNLLAGFLLNRGLLPAREREIVILRVGCNARSVYEFGQHTLIGKECGLTDAEVVALTRDPGAHEWSDDDRALIALADELCADDCVAEPTWERLSGRWSEAELVELLIVAGMYRLVSGFLNSTGVELDEGVPGFPE
jgi:alkylhydroperoxidase family enzyme